MLSKVALGVESVCMGDGGTKKKKTVHLGVGAIARNNWHGELGAGSGAEGGRKAGVALRRMKRGMRDSRIRKIAPG